MALIRIAAVTDIPEGSGKTFEVNGHAIALFNVDGTFYALDDTCSHAEASLGNGEVDSDELTVECPMHGSSFDLRTGHPCTLPAFRPVATYPVHIEGDSVFVEYSS